VTTHTTHVVVSLSLIVFPADLAIVACTVALEVKTQAIESMIGGGTAARARSFGSKPPFAMVLSTFLPAI
jgi:hypothetical protein